MSCVTAKLDSIMCYHAAWKICFRISSINCSCNHYLSSWHVVWGANIFLGKHAATHCAFCLQLCRRRFIPVIMDLTYTSGWNVCHSCFCREHLKLYFLRKNAWWTMDSQLTTIYCPILESPQWKTTVVCEGAELSYFQARARFAASRCDKAGGQ